MKHAQRFLKLTGTAALALILFMGCGANANAVSDKDSKDMVSVRLMTSDGTLSEAVEVPRIEHKPEEWQKALTKEQCYVLREKGTEPPFTGKLLKNKKGGYYLCAACNLPLFESGAKFESGTGWPSFLPAGRQGKHSGDNRSQSWHGPYRSRLRPLWRPPRPRV